MAFERALEVDPKCTEALVGASIMEMNMSSKDDKTRRRVRKMRMDARIKWVVLSSSRACIRWWWWWW